MILFRKALPTDLNDIIQILKKAKLSVAGLDENFEDFMVVEQDGAVIGTGGLEIYEDSAILRSVAILPDFQNQGLGDGLVRAIINYADRRNIRKLYLFTETARDFFEKIGFKSIPREKIDNRCKSSEQYKCICSTSADAMELDIEKFFKNVHCKN